METPPNPQNQQAIIPDSNTPKLYDPKQYLFLGFFLSLVPVFYMSITNCKYYPNGEKIKKTMMKFLAVFVGLIVLNFALILWAVIQMQKFVLSLYNTSTDIPKELELPLTIVENSDLFFIGANIILLIVVTRYTNKNELPLFQEEIANKKATINNMLMPFIIGLIFVGGMYFGASELLYSIALMLV